MKKIILIIAFLATGITVNAQFKLTSTGVCVDENTGKDYVVFDVSGTQKELYDKVLKTAYEISNDPKSVASTIPNEMISILGVVTKDVKYMGLHQTLKVRLTTKFQFKDNKIKVSVSWIDTWINDKSVDVYTLLALGGWRCFNKKDEIVSEKWFNRYNPIANELVNSFISQKKEEDW
jgi:hypothetical protein|nr:MAG TPA: protein of unknown function DUF4468 [Caudoviricetes sp.]